MKIVRFLLFTSITAALVVLLNHRAGSLPPLGKFISPFTGFWQNAETKEKSLQYDSMLKGLQDEASVKLDEQRVPHIFAKNEHDLYFMQGYITARDRLWQMEFMTIAASGRVSEIIGKKAFEFDRTQRRIGIPFAAKNAIAKLDSDRVAKNILTAYSDGVNAFINSLEYKSLPLEYKLLDYRPELWQPYNSALLLKYMSNMLTGKEYDLEFTNVLKFLGKETFDLLFPDFPAGIDPIVPVGTEFHKASVASLDTLAGQSSAFKTNGTFLSSPFKEPDDNPNIGSNNWAVAGSKSTTGCPILCNDPHLRLQLPCIWYQQQLNAPGVNVYGVTIPGAPGVTLGFNDSIAWGVTNASMDVKDWYRIEFKDKTKSEYKYDGKWLPTKKIVEEIKIRDEKSFFDTIVYTHHGPVTYDNNFMHNGDSLSVALRWTAHDPSNEMKTFYLLNRAKNYNDYIAALNYYECPGQNFAFACVNGDIAIKEQGKFIMRTGEEGKFVQDGTTSSSEWKGFIPYSDNPHVLNPTRGFVSSANQHPTDATYPYYYYGIYEYYRNRRINHVLSSKEKFSPADMMKLQNDNYNMIASESLPYFLTMIDVSSLSDLESKAFKDLSSWNFFNSKDEVAPVYFKVMWEKFYELLWDEFLPEEEKGFTTPDEYSTIAFIIQHPEHSLIDNLQTPGKETVKDLVQKAFKEAVADLDSVSKSNGKKLEWTSYKGTRLAHFLPIEAFYVKNLPIGGDLHIVNACTKTHGPSWRMIVALGDPVEAWGIFPGGQSGNPGSPFYSNYAQRWANGEYNPLLFLKDEKQQSDRIVADVTFKPSR